MVGASWAHGRGRSIWPVRYSLQLIDGLPKPFVNDPESPPFAARLRRTPDKLRGQDRGPMPQTDRKDCGDPDRWTVQRREQRSAAAQHALSRPGSQLCRRPLLCGASPLLGSTGFAGEYWTLMADELIDAKVFDSVILAPVAVGASSIAQWAQGGSLNTTDDSLWCKISRRTTGSRTSLASRRVRLRAQDRSSFDTRNYFFRSWRPCAPMWSMRRSSSRRRRDADRLVRIERHPVGSTGARHGRAGVRSRGSTPTICWPPRTVMTIATWRIQAR